MEFYYEVKLHIFKREVLLAWGVLFAGLCIAVIPVIIFYSIFQRHIVKGMTEGAIK